MLTEEDVKKIIEANREVFPSKEEFNQFKGEMKQDLDALRESIQSLTVSVDKLAKA